MRALTGLFGSGGGGMILAFLPQIAIAVFTFIIANFCKKKFNNAASNQMFIGAILQLVNALGHATAMTVMMQDGGFNRVAPIISGLGFLGMIGSVVFLIGLFKLVKGFYYDQMSRGEGPMSKQNNMIQRF